MKTHLSPVVFLDLCILGANEALKSNTLFYSAFDTPSICLLLLRFVGYKLYHK